MGPAWACSCSGTPGARNPWEAAQYNEAWAAAIFEGTPERIELQWNVFRAKAGEMVAADEPGEGTPMTALGHLPRLLVTLRVHRVYKGDVGRTIQVSTGITTSDCSLKRFPPGLTHLVYASRGIRGELSVGTCSPGGWVGDFENETRLRHLRKERPLPSDLSWRKQREATGSWERYLASTGKICGTVIRSGVAGKVSGTVAFLSAIGYSPMDHPFVDVDEEGRFCSGELGPGSYYLYFAAHGQSSRPGAAFYPGVPEREKAEAIEVRAGKVRSGVVFRVPEQKTYAVRGFVSVNDKSTLRGDEVRIWLVRRDGAPWEVWGVKNIDFRGRLPLPRVRYFKFDNALPGQYVAFATVTGRGWFTEVVSLDVTGHSKLVSIELAHRK
jgi:hypothetical protein